MAIQNCSLLKGIRIFSDELENNSYMIGSKLAPSVCRSIISENGRDVLWGKAEQEVELIIKSHCKKILKRDVEIENILLIWEDMGNDEFGNTGAVRRSNIRSIYLHGKEKESISAFTSEAKRSFRQYCKWEPSEDVGGYLTCKDMELDLWDVLMVDVAIRSLPLKEQVTADES